MRGFAALPLVIILIVVGVIGVGWYTFSTRQSAQVISSPSPSSTPLPSSSFTPPPLPTSSSAVLATPKTSSVPATPAPTSSPTPTPANSPSSDCNTSTDLGDLTVNIQPQSGQSLVGDASVTMSNGSGDCAGTDSRLPYVQIIRQGSTSLTFSGYRPGKFHIQVSYHGNNYDQDVSLNSGSNSTTVTVSN